MAARLVPRLLQPLAWLVAGILSHASTSAQRPAETTVTNLPPITVRLDREIVPGMEPLSRVYVGVGTNQLALLAPLGFRIRSEPEQRKVVFSQPEGRCNIQFRLHAPPLAPDAKGLKPEPFRQLLLERHPGAQVVEEYTLSAGGQSGPAFDLAWRTPTGLWLFVRTVYIPSDAGILEFSMITDPDKAAEFRHVFNGVLLTFRSSRGGKLEVTPLSNQL